MKPCKAPYKVDKYLKDIGFGYGDHYYQRHDKEASLLSSVHFGRHSEGFLVHLDVNYFVDLGGVQISPLELSVLWTDGILSDMPFTYESEAFWPHDDIPKLLNGVCAGCESWFPILTNAKLMLTLYDYIIGSAESVPTEFTYIKNKFIRRGASANRFTAVACYHNLLGNFDKAKQVLAQIRADLITPQDRKIEDDASLEQIVIPEETLKYLEKIGAK